MELRYLRKEVVENKFNNQQLELLDELSKTNTNVVAIVDPNGVFRPEIYVVTEIRYPTKDVFNVSISGYKKITDIIAENSTYVHSVRSIDVIVQKIDAMLPVAKERIFSNYFYYIKF